MSFSHSVLVIWNDAFCNRMLTNVNDWTNPFHGILNDLHIKAFQHILMTLATSEQYFIL